MAKAQEQEAAARAKAAKQDTAYVILRGIEIAETDVLTEREGYVGGLTVGEVLWRRMDGVMKASNKDSARRKYLDTLPEGTGERNGHWKAVTLSAWKGGEKIAEETKPVLSREPITD